MTLLCPSAGALLVATAAVAAVSGSGVRVAKDGVGAYESAITAHGYDVAVLATSTTRLEVAMHPYTTCYPSYEMVNGQRVELSPSQQKSFATGRGWTIPIPNIPLSPSGSFHKSETVPGPEGSHPVISGQVNGSTISGTFSVTDIASSGAYHCDNVSFHWTATFDPTAEPDPLIFALHA